MAGSLFNKKFLFVLLFSFTEFLFSGETKFAKYAGDFLTLGAGGRSLGMGGAFTAVANDVTAGYWNPAGLTGMNGYQLILMHDEKFAGLVNYDYLAFGFESASNFFALSVIRAGVDDIHQTNDAFIDYNGNGVFDPEIDRLAPEKFTYFSSADWVFIFSFARSMMKDFSLGGNAKFIYRKIGGNSGLGMGFDLGIRKNVKFLTIGLMLKDITTTLIAWDTGRNELVVPSLVAGFGAEVEILSGKFTPAIDLVFRFEGRKKTAMLGANFASVDLNTGIEYAIKDIVALRFGFTENKELTLGAGVKLNRLDIDYSFARFDSELGNTHRISVKFSIPK